MFHQGTVLENNPATSIPFPADIFNHSERVSRYSTSSAMMSDSETPLNSSDGESEGHLVSAVEPLDEQSHGEITIDLTGGSPAGDELNDPLDASFSPYSYQIEMLEESLKRNIIVAMDTGSGKTHIAILRMIEELRTCPADKFVWFLAPTVDLCLQQYGVIKAEIPALESHMKLLQGNDGVEKWKDKQLWDAILHNVKVVVSTPQILLDALDHAYVYLQSLSLLVLDEAHNYVGKSAGGQIMKERYHRDKARGFFVPHILGLSASPIIKSKFQSPEEIEETLDAICRTPTRTRADLLLQVNMPDFRQILYAEIAAGCELHTLALSILHHIFLGYDINKDPYIIQLRGDNNDRSQRKLDNILMSQKTWCYSQIKSFYATSCVLFRELGAWAADFYIAEVISKVTGLVRQGRSHGEDPLPYEEKQHLYSLFKQVDFSRMTKENPQGLPIVSDKVKQLVNALSRDEPLAGIIFVQQRATVAVLAQLLSVHPHTQSSFRIGTVVGASRHSLRSGNIGELAEPREQGHTLEKFRNGQLDLIIATTVLEEGIDIPACNLVICFDEPPNLKSFVQRRGRARKKESRLVLMQSTVSEKLRQWQELEAEMKRIYADDMRTLREIVEREDLEEHDGRKFRVERTGALLTLDNAVAHLYHFCSLLPSAGDTDLRPEFIFPRNAPAKVILPLCVDAAVRCASSKKGWQSERNARKDAAFEAYVALYKAGLVNDNLMPLLKSDGLGGELGKMVEKRPSLVEAHPLINPWVDVAKAWLRYSGTKPLRKALVTMSNANGEILSTIEMLLPVDIPDISSIRLYWDASSVFSVDIKVSDDTRPDADESIRQAQDDTKTMLSAAFGWRFPVERSDFAALFTFASKAWEAVDDFIISQTEDWKRWPGMGLIRDRTENAPPYIFNEYLNHKPCTSLVKHPYHKYEEVEDSIPHLALWRLPRRAEFLHKIRGTNQQTSDKRFSYVLPATRCVVDEVPFRQAQLALFMPSVLHRLKVFMIGHRLSSTVLGDVKFNNLGLVVTAISASSACEETNYQRLEFLGDSLLKMCTSVQVLAEFPLWHEGYLTTKKDQIISNSRLARAALHVGLDKFIITKSFTGRKWRPLYIKELIESEKTDSKREMSTKVLADVVEALFGAAQLDGGMAKALACMRVFLPEIDWQPLEDRRAAVFERAYPDAVLPPFLEPLEQLIGYSFNKKILLIEAMTHASCHSGTASLERLEFLGDAVLDSIIVNAISGQQVELSHVKMHYLRTALVNADFLAFMCMEWAIEQDTVEVVEDARTHTFQTSTRRVPLALWKFMRCSSRALTTLQCETADRHRILQGEINAALAIGFYYPWTLLSRLKAPKFYSDIVESLLGAVYIDTGSLEVCEGILERMGVLPYLRRVMQDKVHILHPKEELGILADTEKVKYVVGVQKEIVGGVELKAYTCEVYVGEVLVVSVTDGVNMEETKTKAAEAAVRILKERGGNGKGNDVREEERNDTGDVMDTN